MKPVHRSHDRRVAVAVVAAAAVVVAADPTVAPSRAGSDPGRGRGARHVASHMAPISGLETRGSNVPLAASGGRSCASLTAFGGIRDVAAQDPAQIAYGRRPSL